MSGRKFNPPEPYARTEIVLVVDAIVAVFVNMFLVVVHALRLALTVAAFA